MSNFAKAARWGGLYFSLFFQKKCRAIWPGKLNREASRLGDTKPGL
jgi:hypothetical protein